MKILPDRFNSKLMMAGKNSANLKTDQYKLSNLKKREKKDKKNEETPQKTSRTVSNVLARM